MEVHKETAPLLYTTIFNVACGYFCIVFHFYFPFWKGEETWRARISILKRHVNSPSLSYSIPAWKTPHPSLLHNITFLVIIN
jgi:hypothetical protein